MDSSTIVHVISRFVLWSTSRSHVHRVLSSVFSRHVNLYASLVLVVQVTLLDALCAPPPTCCNCHTYFALSTMQSHCRLYSAHELFKVQALRMGCRGGSKRHGEAVARGGDRNLEGAGELQLGPFHSMQGEEIPAHERSWEPREGLKRYIYTYTCIWD